MTESETGGALAEWPLFGFSDDARPLLSNARRSGTPVALATIIGLSGGGPRPVGTQMAFTGEDVSGFLSGGCLESDVAGHAAEVLANGHSRRLTYGEGSPWPDIRLMCGARMDILLERIAPDDGAVETLLSLTEARTPAVWVSDGERRACGPQDDAPASWPRAFQRPFRPAPRLVVLGADPTALAIAALGAEAGWETTLVRPNGPAKPPPLAGVAYSREDAAEAMAAVGLDPWTAIAAATHDAELDHAALIAALPSSAFYVGALGARRRRGERETALLAAGVAPEDIARLRTPIGLELGGKAPWEVAVAALAEIIQAWNAGDGDLVDRTRSAR
jgi:xanthine dehydrogenase accessory factor